MGDGASENALAGRLEDITFHGDHVRLRVGLRAGAELVVKLGPREAPLGLERGQDVMLGFDARDCRALDPAAGGAD